MNAFDLAIKDLPDVELSQSVQDRHLRYLLSLPDFDDADLTDTDLTDTDLADADLTDTDLTDADLTDGTVAGGTTDPEAGTGLTTTVVDLAAVEQRRRRRRRRYLAGGITAAVLIAGTGTAAAFGFFDKVTNTNTAYCYASASLDDGLDNRIEFATQGTDSAPYDAAASGVDICQAYWRAGVFQLGKPADIDRAPTGGLFPVPPLIACVLPSGQAGIFPGDKDTCGALGLAPYVKE